MIGKYPILDNGITVGQAEISKSGMYYLVRCVCKMKPEIHHRITVFCGDEQIDLGVSVPNGEGTELRTRIPVRQMYQGIPRFQIVQQEKNENWYELCPENAYTIISQINNTRYCIKENKPGVLIRPEE